MIYDPALDELLQKVWDGRRVNQTEALRLYQLPLEDLGALADRRRQIARAAAYDGRGNEIVTYIVDRNINYTNVCNVYCKFCAFYRTEKDADSYVISKEEMDRKIEETVALGGTQILLQGGHHPGTRALAQRVSLPFSGTGSCREPPAGARHNGAPAPAAP